MLVCRENSLPKNGSWQIWAWGEICIQVDRLVQSFQMPEGGSLSFGGGSGMELPGVWDLGYSGWVKATDHTQNCKCFLIMEGLFPSRVDTYPYWQWVLIRAQIVVFEVLALQSKSR